MSNRNRLLFYFLISMSFYNCFPVKSNGFTNKAPLEITAPYYNAWIAGVQGGGAGINVFLPVSDSQKIKIDSIHFRGQKVKAVVKGQLIIGRFKRDINQQQDIIMSSDPKEEYQNKLPFKHERSPFNLADDACVLSYSIGDKRLYYKVSNLKQGLAEAYPSVPPN